MPGVQKFQDRVQEFPNGCRPAGHRPDNFKENARKLLKAVSQEEIVYSSGPENSPRFAAAPNVSASYEPVMDFRGTQSRRQASRGDAAIILLPPEPVMHGPSAAQSGTVTLLYDSVQ